MSTVPARRLMRSIVTPSTRCLPTIQLEDVVGGEARLKSVAPLAGPGGNNEFQVGDVLFGKLRPYLGKSLLVSAVSHGSGEFLCLRPRGAIEPRYLLYVTLSRGWLDHAKLSSYGVKMPRTSWDAMAEVRVFVPSLGDQRRIADFLDDRVARIDQIIADRRRQVNMVQEWATSKLDDEISALGRTQGWTEVRRFGMRIEQGWSPEAQAVPAERYEPGVLKLGSVRDGQFVPQENKAMLPNMIPREPHRVRRGDLLITRANTPSLVGSCAYVVDEPEPHLYLSDLIYRVSLAGFRHDAANAALRSRRVRQLIGVLARGTSGSMPKLRGEDIASLELPNIDRDDQARLAALDSRLRAQSAAGRDLHESAITLLQEYKQSLITAAVTGEFDVTAASTRMSGA